MRGHCSNASTLPGGSPTFSTRRDSRRRPLIRSAGWDPRVPIKRRGYPHPHHRRRKRRMRVGACGSRPSKYRSASGVPAASVQARNSRGPGSHCGGTVLTAPRVQSRGDGHQPRVHRGAHQRGVLVGAGDLRLQSGLGDHLGEGLGAPQPIDHHRQPRGSRPRPPAPPGPVRRGSRSGRRPRAAPTLPRRTTAGSRNRQ